MSASSEDPKGAARPLDARELEILSFLLTLDATGIEELRQQIPFALATSWTCGCASIDLEVDHHRAPASSIEVNPAIEAETIERDDRDLCFDLLLWVENGYLAGIEIVDYAEVHGEVSAVFPPAAAFHPPRASVES